jgi:hypothetical protein
MHFASPGSFGSKHTPARQRARLAAKLIAREKSNDHAAKTVSAMPDREISAEGEEGFRMLHALFGAAAPSAVPKRGCRRYVLEFRDGQPIFQRANPPPVHPRDEIELMLNQIIAEEFGDDIVPQKLAKAFPGSSVDAGHY